MTILKPIGWIQVRVLLCHSCEASPTKGGIVAWTYWIPQGPSRGIRIRIHHVLVESLSIKFPVLLRKVYHLFWKSRHWSSIYCCLTRPRRDHSANRSVIARERMSSSSSDRSGSEEKIPVGNFYEPWPFFPLQTVNNPGRCFLPVTIPGLSSWQCRMSMFSFDLLFPNFVQESKAGRDLRTSS